MDEVVITDPAGAAVLAGEAAVIVAGFDAAVVGEAVAGLRASGTDAAGWVGAPSDPAVAEMAAELFPGRQVTTRF